MPTTIGEDTSNQLRLIAEILDALEAAGVACWLFGGWAIDFYAHEVTRDHSDIEAFIWLDDAEKARVVLMAAGFIAVEGLHPDEGQPFLKDGQEIGLWYLVRNERSEIVTPGRWADWPWVPGSFDGAPGRIGTVIAPVVSLNWLLDTKSNFATYPHGAPLREKDTRDIERLQRLIAAQSR